MQWIDAVGFWLSLAVGVAAYVWPQFLLRSDQRFPEGHLCEISPRFQGLNRAIGWHDALTFVISIAAILFVITRPSFQTPAVLQAGRLAFPAGLLAFIGLMQGVFAAWRGVYPVARYRGRGTFFAYTPGDGMARLGKQQIFYALGVIALALLAGWLRWQAG